MATEIIRANKSGTKYFFIKNNGTESGASNQNTNYVGNYDYKEYRSRLSFSPDKNKFKDQLITKAVVRVYVRSADYSTPTILKINTPNGSQADSNSAYVSAKYCMENEKNSPTSNGAYIDLEITDSDALKYINEYCTNGQTFSIYLGRKTDSYKSGTNYCIYVGVNDDSYNKDEYPRITLTYVPNASTGSINPNPTIGDKFTVNIVKASSDYTHNIIIQSNIDSKIKIESGRTSNTSWSPTITEEDTYKWIASSASSQSNTKLIIETYLDDSLLGKNEYNFTLYAKTNPVVNWTTALNASSGSLTTLVSGYGKVTLNLKTTPVDTSSPISYFRVKINSCNVVVDRTYEVKDNSNSITINDLPKPYTASDTTFSINVYAINNRGKESAPTTIQTMCYAYALPSTILNPIRASDQYGKEDINGTYIYNNTELNYTPINGQNSITRVTVKIEDTIIKDEYNPESLTFYKSGASTESEYNITVTIKDRVSENTITSKIPSSNFLIHIKTGGKSIGIGSAAGDDETIKLGWKLLVDNGITLNKPLSIESGGTGVSSLPGLKEILGINNLNYLQLSGGTLSGDLSINGALSTTDSNKAITLMGNNFTYNGNDVLVLNKNVFYSSEEPSERSIGTIWLKI